MFNLIKVTPLGSYHICDSQGCKRRFDNYDQIMQYIKEAHLLDNSIVIYYTNTSAFTRTNISMLNHNVASDSYFSVCRPTNRGTFDEVRRYEVKEVYESQI